MVLTAIMKAKVGSGDDLERIIKGIAPKFLNDPGCIEYRVQRRLDDPQQFLFYERYENDEALAFHAATPHFKELFAALKPLLDGKAEIVTYTEV